MKDSSATIARIRSRKPGTGDWFRLPEQSASRGSASASDAFTSCDPSHRGIAVSRLPQGPSHAEHADTPESIGAAPTPEPFKMIIGLTTLICLALFLWLVAALRAGEPPRLAAQRRPAAAGGHGPPWRAAPISFSTTSRCRISTRICACRCASRSAPSMTAWDPLSIFVSHDREELLALSDRSSSCPGSGRPGRDAVLFNHRADGVALPREGESVPI
jgi:hypothetical protein